MIISELQSDDVVLAEIGARLARTRLSQNRSQAQLALEAGVSRETVQRLEAGESVRLTALIGVLRRLGLLANLDVAIPDVVASPIEQLDSRAAPRRRASASRAGSKWRWGTP